MATIVAHSIFSAQGYITAHGALPARRQMQWLKEMTVDICESKVGALQPDQIMQAPELMWAWSHTKHTSKENALAVESLVKRLIDERRAGNEQADVTVHDYNCLLEGWARSGVGEAAAERCEQILSAMQEQGGLVRPNLSSFKAALMAWRQSQVSYSPHRAQRLLEWMIQLYKEGENESALPDADCFDFTLQTWGRSGHKHAPKQAEHILVIMERLYKTTGDVKLKPRTTSFNAVLAAWSKSVDPKAADRASDVLAFMELLASKGDTAVAPDSASYSTVMVALAKHKDQAAAALKADAFVRRVEEGYRSEQQLLPDAIVFNTAMGCWAKANVSGAYRKARSILDRQISIYEDGCERCKPDVYGFTSVIASCAAEPGNKEERAKAFNVARSTYKQLLRHEDGPNHVSYGIMLKACARLLPANSKVRRKWVRDIFEQCKADGCVGDMVVSRLRETASPDVYKELMQGYNKKTLPAEWTAKVEEKNQFRSKRTRQHRKRAEV